MKVVRWNIALQILYLVSMSLLILSVVYRSAIYIYIYIYVCIKHDWQFMLQDLKMRDKIEKSYMLKFHLHQWLTDRLF
jgi:hypothetical protein